MHRLPDHCQNWTQEPSQSRICAAASTVTTPVPAVVHSGLNARPALEPRLLALSPSQHLWQKCSKVVNSQIGAAVEADSYFRLRIGSPSAILVGATSRVLFPVLVKWSKRTSLPHILLGASALSLACPSSQLTTKHFRTEVFPVQGPIPPSTQTAKIHLTALAECDNTNGHHHVRHRKGRVKTAQDCFCSRLPTSTFAQIIGVAILEFGIILCSVLVV